MTKKELSSCSCSPHDRVNLIILYAFNRCYCNALLLTVSFIIMAECNTFNKLKVWGLFEMTATVFKSRIRWFKDTTSS